MTKILISGVAIRW